MNHTPQDELLSAYLDDELAPEERAEVERMLEENPASRLLLEELKALRTTVQSLPRESLGPDFSKHVMQMAERSVLAGSAATDGPLKTADSQHPVSTKVDIHQDSEHDWRQRFIRPLAFATLAIAAALTLMFLQPDELGDQSPSGTIAREDRPLEAPPTIGPPADTLGVPKEGSSLTDPAAAQRRTNTISRKGDVGVRMQVETEAIPEAAPPAANEPQVGVPVMTQGRQDSRNIDRGALVTQGQTAAAEDTRAFNYARSKQLVGEQFYYQSNAAAPLYSIQLDVTPDAARSKTLDSTLKRNGIKITSSAFGGGGETDEVAEDEVAQRVAPIDVVYVELTQSQLESVLTDIADQPVYFSNIMVPTNPDFAGQNPGTTDGSHFAQQQAMPAEAEQVAPAPSLGGVADLDSDGATEHLQEVAPASPEGVAQRFQLPQLSNSWFLEQKLEENKPAKPAAEEEAISESRSTGRQRSPEATAKQGVADTPTTDQMFRALFIQRVVPSIDASAVPSETSPAPESPASEEPSANEE